MSPTFPSWLHGLAWASLALAVLCAVLIAADEARRPQKMAVMNLVWPLCALFGSVIWLAFYVRSGRAPPRGAKAPGGETPFPVSVTLSASHCGAGCTAGDIVAEALAAAFPGVLLAFGWRSLFAEPMFAVWGLDLLLAFLFGIAFQYFALKPMSDDPPAALLLRALKADALSIVAWQVGMYGGMALLQFGLARPVFGGMATAAQPEFWLMMQIAMLAGFLTSWPVNAWLIRAGVKGGM